MLINRLGEYLKIKRGAIHVGANVGEERHWYHNNGFSIVFWFEPNREIFKILKENISVYPNQFAVNWGVHDILDKGVLHVANNEGQSSSLLDLGTHKRHHPEVHYIKDQKIALVRMDEFFSKEWMKEFNFLNVDVQGVELNVIKSFGDSITYLDYINAEVNEEEVYEKGALIGEIDEYLHNYGFSREVTEMTKFHWGDALYVRDGII
jgi:FkbM family methyltransferase